MAAVLVEEGSLLVWGRYNGVAGSGEDHLLPAGRGIGQP